MKLFPVQAPHSRPRRSPVLRRTSVLGALFLAGCASTAANGPAPRMVTPPPPALAPSDSYGLFLSGQQAASEGDLTRSAGLFDQASVTDPQDPFLRAKAFSILVLAGQLDRAAAVAASGPVDADDTVTGLVQVLRAVNALAEGRGRDAQSDLADNPALGPHSVVAALIRPWAAAAAGDWKTATAPSGPGTDKLVVAFGGVGRAQLLERSGRLSEADAAFKAIAASREPIFILAYGAFLERRGRATEAVALYTQALARAPDDPALSLARRRAQSRGAAPAAPTLLEGPADCLINLAALLIGDHQPEVGLSYLRLALRLDPGRTDAWVLAGETLSQLGDLTGSRAAFLQVRPGSPSYTAARIRLALSFQQVGDRTQALKITHDALAAAPGDVETEVVYAELLRDAQRYEEAIAVLNGCRLEAERVRAAMRLGDREAGHDLIRQQRLEKLLFLLRRAVMGQDLAIAGIWRLRAEDDRPEPGAAELLVHERELDLAVALAAKLRPEMATPQSPRLDLRLQRPHQADEFGIVNIPGAAEDVFKGLDLLSGEVVDPVDLGLELWISRETPHGMISCLIPAFLFVAKTEPHRTV